MDKPNDDISRYAARGVSASKEDVHAAIKDLDKGLYPNTFCKVFPDFLANDANWCNLMSSDGSGTKSAIAYLYWKETGDVSVWEGIAEDVIVMNLDDLLCTGATQNFLFSSVINRNKHLIPGEVIAAIIRGSSNFFHRMQEFGIDIQYVSGETADLGDLVRTITVDGSMVLRMKRDEIIQNNIKPGQVIVGLASFGQCNYESAYNSGIGSNGLTSARHDLLEKSYASKYPETFDPNTNSSFIYSGSCKLTDPLEGTPLNIGKALLSPTRSFAPVIQKVLREKRAAIDAIIHCTGGAQTKILHFMNQYHVVKDNLFAPPPLFELIQNQSGTSWEEMFKVFNMGTRLEIYTDERNALNIIELSQSFGVEAQIIGHVEASDEAQVTVKSPYGVFNYKA
jgi:phosphoribosylformylglycinamidine cyclo-ligase